MFFNFLMAEGLTTSTTIRDIPLSELEKLTVDDTEKFIIMLRNRKSSKAKKNDPEKFEYSEVTIARKISSLRSLFAYLNEREYLSKNIWEKTEVKVPKTTPAARAASLRKKLLVAEEIKEFIEFVAAGYLAKCDSQKKEIPYLFNRERDAAIVALLLGSGIRLSELVGLNLDDIDYINQEVKVVRKGNFVDNPTFADTAKHYLQEYEKVRGKYRPERNESAFFLSVPNKFIMTRTIPNSSGSRIGRRAVQDLILKYAEAFDNKKITPHSLRHAFASEFNRRNPNLSELRDQLGHSDTKTTERYAHANLDSKKRSVKSILNF